MEPDLNKPIPLSVKRLAKSFSFLHHVIWSGIGSCITLDEISEKIKLDSKDLVSKPITIEDVQSKLSQDPVIVDSISSNIPMWQYLEEREAKEFRDFHLSRIAYLVKNPTTDPISIDVGVPSLGCNPSWPIDDGNHRLGAAIARGDETILVNFSGAVPEINRFIQKYGPKTSRKPLTKSA